MYSGYRCDTTINNVIAYGADGKVFLCAINFPGSWHDGSICSIFLPIIKDQIGVFIICVDQEFPKRGTAFDGLVGPLSRTLAS